MLFYLICIALSSCSITKPDRPNPIPNEELVHIQAIPLSDTTSTFIQIYGCVKEYRSGEPVLFGSVAMYKNGVFKQGAETDFDGQFSLKSFDWDSTATYAIEFGYVGFYTVKIDDFPLQNGVNYELECSLSAEAPILEGPYCPSYRVPLIELDNTTSGQIITSEQIKNRH